MPNGSFKFSGIIIATAAAIIASQALISGSFTLISEAMRLNLWPRLRINYPTEERGQLYIPGINFLLFFGCMRHSTLFQKIIQYGSCLWSGHYTLYDRHFHFVCQLPCFETNQIILDLSLPRRLSHRIEFSFLFANLDKFPHGGYVTLIVGGGLFVIMYVWYRCRKIKNRYVEFVRLEHYLPMIQELSNDKTVPKYATHLVYMTSANNPKEIEHKIIYSILNKKPKRADIYWFVHVDTLDDPYTCEYEVDHIIPNDIIRVEFQAGLQDGSPRLI